MGYFPDNYFPDNFFQDEYWPVYGVVVTEWYESISFDSQIVTGVSFDSDITTSIVVSSPLGD